jgi:hypothetical protein
MVDQTQAQEAVRRYPNRYPKGVSGNLAGRPSHAEKRARAIALAHQYAEPIGGWLSLPASSQDLLMRAAELAQYRPARYDQRLRAANVCNRIIRDVYHRHKPAGGNSASPLRERLAAGGGV